jgi:hypothetical protein
VKGEWVGGSDETSAADTKKPLHFFCVLALLAFLMSAAQDWLAIYVRTVLTGGHFQVEHVMVGYLVWQSLTVLTGSAVQYGGLALAVELIDRLRWSMLPEGERARQRSRYMLIRLFRTANADV